MLGAPQHLGRMSLWRVLNRSQVIQQEIKSGVKEELKGGFVWGNNGFTWKCDADKQSMKSTNNQEFTEYTNGNKLILSEDVGDTKHI